MGRGIYHVFGSMIQSGAGQMMMLHFIDCTEFVHLRDDSETRRPAIAVIAIDNYEELLLDHFYNSLYCSTLLCLVYYGLKSKPLYH